MQRSGEAPSVQDILHANLASSYTGVLGTLLTGGDGRSCEIAAGLHFIRGLVSRALKPILFLAAWLE